MSRLEYKSEQLQQFISPAQVAILLSYYPAMHPQVFPESVLYFEEEQEVQALAYPQQVVQD